MRLCVGTFPSISGTETLLGEHMKAKEKFELLLKESEKLEKAKEQAEFLCKVNRDQIEDAFREMLAEDKILAQHDWYLCKLSGGTAMLQANATSRTWKELSEIAESNYHCSFSLAKDDGHIMFNDGTVEILVQGVGHLKHLIDKYSINVHLDPALDKDLKRYQNSIDAINEWKQTLGKSK